MRSILSFLLTTLTVFAVHALEEENANLPGKKADGSMLLPNQWRLRPAGTQVDLGDGAVNSSLHPSGKFIAIQHAGYSKHAIFIVDIPEAKIVDPQLTIVARDLPRIGQQVAEILFERISVPGVCVRRPDT